MGLDNTFYQPLQIAVMLPRQPPVVKDRASPLHDPKEVEYHDDYEDDQQHVDHRVERHAFPFRRSYPTP